MARMIGVDEAGLGPNLGPLVVVATLWHSASPGQGKEGSPDSTNSMPDLYEVLRDAVSPAPTDGRIAIADSKLLYQAGGGLRLLERGVHAACLAATSCESGTSTGPRSSAERAAPNTWNRLVNYLQADPDDRQGEMPWQRDFDCNLPTHTTADEVTELGNQLWACGRAASVHLQSLRARLVFPAEFNRLIEHFGSKGLVLSHVTLSLVRALLEDSSRLHAAEPVTDGEESFLVVCDKHGGRNRYGPLLQHHFPERWLETLIESRMESRYRWLRGEPSSPEGNSPLGSTNLEFAFRVSGEAFLPTALASMVAKYLRELSMRAFNEFWSVQVPGVRPTAGYPVDARRFKADIDTMQRELRIADHILWRTR